MFNVVDDFSREVLAIEIDVGLSAERVKRVLDQVVAWRGYPSKLRMDIGPDLFQARWPTGPKSMRSIWNLFSPASPCKIPMWNDSIVPIELRY